MEDNNRIIESISISFIKARNINILHPVTIKNNYDVENSLIYVSKGGICYGKDKEQVEEGEVLFIPGGKQLALTYGKGKTDNLTKDEFLTNKEKYFQTLKDDSFDQEGISYVSFDSKVFDSVNFFASLDITSFVIRNNPKLISIIREINF